MFRYSKIFKNKTLYNITEKIINNMDKKFKIKKKKFK